MLRYSLYGEDQVRESDLIEPYGSDNSSAADNQQERLVLNARILRDYTPDTDLHR